MPSVAIGNGVKINHALWQEGASGSVAVMTMTVMTAGGFIFSEVVGCLQSYLYIIYILYIDRVFFCAMAS